MRKLLMILVLILSLGLFCAPVVAQGEEPVAEPSAAPASEQPSATAEPEAEPPPLVTKEELAEVEDKILKGVEGIIAAEKTGDVTEDYLKPIALLLISVLLIVLGGAATRFGIPYLRDLAKKAGIELSASTEKLLNEIVDDVVVLIEAFAESKLKKGEEKPSSADKAAQAKDSIIERLKELGIELAEALVEAKITSRHAKLAADPIAPVNRGTGGGNTA